MTKIEIMDQLKNEGVESLEDLAGYLIKKTHEDGDESKPVVNAAIIVHHGFVSH